MCGAIRGASHGLSEFLDSVTQESALRLWAVGEDPPVVEKRHRNGEPTEQAAAQEHQWEHTDDATVRCCDQILRWVPECPPNDIQPRRSMVTARTRMRHDIGITCCG